MKTKQLNKIKHGYSALVISVMCAIIMTIIGQSLNNDNNIYAGAYSTTDDLGLGNSHASAPHTSYSEYGTSYSFVDDIRAFIELQKQTINTYIIDIEKQFGLHTNDVTIQPETQMESHELVPSLEPSFKPEYLSFEQLKNKLLTQQCDIPASIQDNNHPKLIPHIQWGLQHCLITVSSAQKVYPTDILTHKMMRLIAQRVGFTIKMEYASDNNVTRADLVNFMYTLQQQHKISDLPVIQTSNPVTRGEYITILHSIFGDSPNDSITTVDHTQIETLRIDTPKTANNNITVKEFKQTLIDQGKSITINDDDAHTPLSVEIINTILSEGEQQSSGIGVDAEVLKQTLNWLIEKI